MTLSENRAAKVSDFWAEHSPEKLGLQKTFYGYPPFVDYAYTLVTGEPRATPSENIEGWTIRTFLADRLPVENCLSLCCGFGHVERILAGFGTFRHCTGLDLSAGAIQEAQRLAREAGYTHIDYQTADLNTLELPAEKYDLIYANGALHHIQNLEHLVGQLYRSLKPGGIFVCNEYIGPNYQQISVRQQEIINAVIHLIPPQYRSVTDSTYCPPFFQKSRLRRAIFKIYRMVSNLAIQATTGRDKALFRFGKLWEERSTAIKERDPSESMCSGDIIDILKATFKQLDVRYYNGSVLYYALDKKFYETCDPTNPRDKELLNLLITIEKTLIQMGELSSDNAHIIGTKV
jgi:ubiquinone/menaquinone biosynthesis C-methylase UbiE